MFRKKKPQWPARIVTAALILVLSLLAVERTGPERVTPWEGSIELHSLPLEAFWLPAIADIQGSHVPLLVLRTTGDLRFEPVLGDERAERDIGDWASFLDAPVTFNGGQFYENGEYMGWLRYAGTWLSKTRHPTWQGILASDGDGVRLLDTRFDPVPAPAIYPSLAQSMMLFDRKGNLRVRASGRLAARTVVAEDNQGRLLLIASAGELSLADLGQRLMREKELDLMQAMNLDGGAESQLAIRDPAIAMDFYGETSFWRRLASRLGIKAHRRLPYAFTLHPLENSDADESD